MSDAADYNANLASQAQNTVWDPTIGTVFAPQGATNYVQQNPQNYQGYTGQVAAPAWTGMPSGPTADALVPGVTGVAPPAPPPDGGFDPYAFNVSQQRASVGLTDNLNPYAGSAYGGTDPYGANGGGTYQAFANTVQRIPGGNPTYGVLPGTDSYYNLLSNQPVDASQIDPVTAAARQRMTGGPTLAQSGGPGGIYGRGYHYSGGQWKTNPLSGMQNFATHYYGPAIMAAPAIAASIFAPGISAPLLAGTFGAMAAGAQTHYQNPAAIALGGAAGAAAGYGGSQLGAALGTGPVVGGALGGASGAVGNQLGQAAATGQIDPANLGRAAAIGAGAGAVSGGIGALGQGSYTNTPSEPGGAVSSPGNPYIQAMAKPASQLFGNTVAAYWPANDPRRRVQALNPYRGQR